MSFADEFLTVDAVLSTHARTSNVDAFSLSLIKAEKQIRKLFTHLVFQYPCFSYSDVIGLREALANNRRVFFEGFEQGINLIYPRSIESLIGSNYGHLNKRLLEAIEHRNKIFHGQITKNGLSENDLKAYVDDIRKWCEILSREALTEIHYDGFQWNSFRKSDIQDIHNKYKFPKPITGVQDYEAFIYAHMRRP